ncbi:hypothetical protein ACNKHS_01195 [Shigella flexneri]
MATARSVLWIDRDWLAELDEGLLLIFPVAVGRCRGNVCCAVTTRWWGSASLLVLRREYFPDRYYLELIRTGRAGRRELCACGSRPGGSAWSACGGHQRCALPESRAILTRTGSASLFTTVSPWGDPKRPRNYYSQQYMRNEEEMCELFSDVPEALENSVEIAKRCNVTVRLGEYFLPQLPTGDMTTEDFLVIVK